MGLIAFKLYKDCPPEMRPEGIPLDCPWVNEFIDDSQYAKYASHGYVILTQEDYDSYVASIQDKMTAWNEWRQSRAVMVSIRDGILTPAMVFGQNLIKEFASENIAMGITQAGMTGTIRTLTANIVTALQTGSLYDAIAASRAIPSSSYDSTFVTEARLINYINKIEDYLGIPRSTSL